MERLSEENRIKVAKAKIFETECLKEAEINQHLELAYPVDCRSDRVNDWVNHALENQKGPDGSIFFEACNLYKYRKWFASTQNVSTAGNLPRPLSPSQTLGCDLQGYLNQLTVPFSDGNGTKHAVSTNPEHETQSLPISNNAAPNETNTLSFYILALTAATITLVCCYFSVPHPSTSIQHISVNNFSNKSRAVGNLPSISSQ